MTYSPIGRSRASRMVVGGAYSGCGGAYPPTHPRAGSNSARQSVGDPGHCERCAEVGHVKAHPNLGCGDVGCEQAHEETP